MTTVAAPVPAIAPATMNRRFVAYVIDGVIGSLFSLLVTFGLAPGTLSADQTIDTLERTLIVAAFSLSYFVVTWTRMGGSPGQRILGVRTVNASDGSLLTNEQAVKRWLFLYGIPDAAVILSLFPGGESASALIFIWAIVLYVTVRRDPQLRGLHDKQSGSIVIRAPY